MFVCVKMGLKIALCDCVCILWNPPEYVLCSVVQCPLYKHSCHLKTRFTFWWMLSQKTQQAKGKKEGIYYHLQQVRRGPGICYRVAWTWRTWYLSAAKMGSSVCSVQPWFRFSSPMGHGGARSPSLPCGCQGRMCALRDGRSPKRKENGAEIGTFHFSQAHQLYKLSLLS